MRDAIAMKPMDIVEAIPPVTSDDSLWDSLPEFEEEVPESQDVSSSSNAVVLFDMSRPNFPEF
jgi:hypothetical protein